MMNLMDSLTIPPVHYGEMLCRQGDEAFVPEGEEGLMLDTLLDAQQTKGDASLDYATFTEWAKDNQHLGSDMYRDSTPLKKRRRTSSQWDAWQQFQFSSPKLGVQSTPNPLLAFHSFSSFDSLGHFFEKKEEFTCPYGGCPMKYDQIEKLRAHIVGHSTSPTNSQVNFRLLAMTPTYITKDADGKQVFLCPFPGCSCKYLAPDSLMSHMEQHKEGAKRHFKCDKCNVVFYSAGCLKSHKISHTKKTNKYVCSVKSCGKQYSTAEGLRLHIRNHHQVSKKWKCMSPGCTRSFVRQADLRMHIIRMHTVERPYPCKEKGCTKAFACHSELRRHAAAHHNKVIPVLDKKGKVPVQPQLVTDLLQKAVYYQKREGLC